MVMTVTDVLSFDLASLLERQCEAAKCKEGLGTWLDCTLSYHELIGKLQAGPRMVPDGLDGSRIVSNRPNLRRSAHRGTGSAHLFEEITE